MPVTEEGYANVFSCVLGANITSGTTGSVLVDSTANAPSGQYRLVVGSPAASAEYLLVTTVDATHVSIVTRACEDASAHPAATHSSGDVMTHVLTRVGLGNLITVQDVGAGTQLQGARTLEFPAGQVSVVGDKATVGGVTSVALTVPADKAVSGSPITGSGTLAITDSTQSANTVKAGPTSGGAATPTYRALVAADGPAMVASGASHASGLVPDPGASSGTTKFLREDATFAVPPGTGLTSAYTEVDDEGTALTARTQLNFVGRGVIADDSGSKSRVRILDPVSMVYEFEEFLPQNTSSGSIGKLGWVNNSIGGGPSGYQWTAPVAGHPGILTINGSGTSGNGGQVGLEQTAAPGILLPADTFDCLFIVRSTDMDANANYRFGLFGDNGNPPANGIYIEGLGTDFAAGVMTWFGVTRSASSQTRTTTSQTTAANVWVRFRIRRIDSTHVGFTVNDTTEISVTLTIPTAALYPQFQIVAAASSAARHLDIDFWDCLITGLSR